MFLRKIITCVLITGGIALAGLAGTAMADQQYTFRFKATGVTPVDQEDSPETVWMDYLQANDALISSDLTGGFRLVGPLTGPLPSEPYPETEIFRFQVSNTNLTNIDSLSPITTVQQMVVIDKNSRLNDLDGLSGVTTAQGVNIALNSRLTDVASLSSMRAVNSITIQSNYGLKDISGFSALEKIGGSLTIRHNTQMSSISGFSKLESIEGAFFYIEKNNYLDNIDGFTNLETVAGSMKVMNNRKLSNLDGFSSLRTVGYSFKIAGGYALTDVSALANLRHVGGGIRLIATNGITKKIPANAWICQPGNADEIGGDIPRALCSTT